jgi:hypothetical protein
VTHFALNISGAGEIRKFGETGVPPPMTLTLGILEFAACAGADNDVTPSSRRLFLQFTRSP